MHVKVNGTRLGFDVDGPALVPDGPEMRERPTVVLLHGGPGTYDHSYLKPDFAGLSEEAQVVFLDLRGHGRSEWGDPAAWSFELCADDVRAFCDTLGIAGPVVYGHSMGGFVAMLYAARHPRHPAALVLQSTNARFDLTRLVEGFRRFGGDEVAELARRDYGGDPVVRRGVGPRLRPVRTAGAWNGGACPQDQEPGARRARHGTVPRSTFSTSCLTSALRRWSAWASSIPSPQWPPPARSPTRFSMELFDSRSITSRTTPRFGGRSSTASVRFRGEQPSGFSPRLRPPSGR
jgi:pimeloyl-ACP methyl ester carboxylesterase